MATIYLSERAAGDLEKMMPLNWHYSEDGDSEMWTALACLLYSNNSLNTAAYFAQRVRIQNITSRFFTTYNKLIFKIFSGMFAES